MASQVIDGVEVTPLYVLMAKADALEDGLAALPKGHPDREEWVELINATYAEIEQVRK